MPRAQWTLMHGSPTIEIVLTLTIGGVKDRRMLIADTGAGRATSAFELLLDVHDCQLCAGKASKMVTLGGAYTGSFPLFVVPIEIPTLGFSRAVAAVALPAPPRGFQGIAGFRFLNRFTYGNFGTASEFGLEC